jgi:hypothetical protein
VSNLSTVAELRTFDGIQYKSGMVLNTKEMSNKHEVNDAIITDLSGRVREVPWTKEF